jgi:hypothetical protein
MPHGPQGATGPTGPSGLSITLNSNALVIGATGAAGVAYETAQPAATSEVHPHDWHLPESAMDGLVLLLVLATAGLVALDQRLRRLLTSIALRRSGIGMADS